MRKIKYPILILISVAVLVAAKFIFFPGSSKKQSAGAKQGGNAGVPVRVQTVKAENVRTQFSAVGNIMAMEEAELRSEVSGKITELYIKEGSKVKKGALLVKINDADLRAQLKKLQSEANTAKAQLERLQALIALRGVSQEEVDRASSTLDAARADIEGVYAQIAKTEIRAPFDGTIGLRYVSPGSYVTPASPIAVIQQADRIKLDFSIPERYASRISVGDSVFFTFEGNERTYTGNIYATEPKIDLATRTLRVRAVCDNPGGKILPGTFAKVALVLRSQESIMVPSEAVVPDLKGKKVYIVKGGKAVAVPVEAGQRTESSVEILSGLSPGDSLITEGLMQLRPDTPVKIMKGGRK